MNILFHCLKSWKDHLQYEKFIMGANLAALKFRKDCNTSLAKACFDALRQHKETSKFERVYQILNEEELPLIDQLAADNESFTASQQLKATSQACQTVKKLVSKQLYSYFKHWQAVNENYKEKLRTSIKGKIIQLYMETMRKTFNQWKVNHDGVKIEQHQMLIDEMQQEQQELQNQVIELKKNL